MGFRAGENMSKVHNQGKNELFYEKNFTMEGEITMRVGLNDAYHFMSDGQPIQFGGWTPRRYV